MADITPRQHKISIMDYVAASNWTHFSRLKLYKPLMLSLPSNDTFKSLLTSCSTRLTNRYLVTRIIQCPPDPDQPGSNITIVLLCTIEKLFIWHRNESNSSVAEEWSGNGSGPETEDDQSDESGPEMVDDQSDERGAETEGDQVTRVNDVDAEMKL